MTDSRVAIGAGVSSSTGSAIEVGLAMRRVKVPVATHHVREGEEIVWPIKEAGTGDIFVKTNVTNEDVIRLHVGKPATTNGRVVYAFDNTGIEEMMKPVYNQKSGRSTVFETMKSMHLSGGVGYPVEIPKAAIWKLSDKAFRFPDYTPLVDGEFVSLMNTLQI